MAQALVVPIHHQTAAARHLTSLAHLDHRIQAHRIHHRTILAQVAAPGGLYVCGPCRHPCTQIVADPAPFISQLLAKASQHGLAGFDIDYEPQQALTAQVPTCQLQACSIL